MLNCLQCFEVEHLKSCHPRIRLRAFAYHSHPFVNSHHLPYVVHYTFHKGTSPGSKDLQHLPRSLPACLPATAG